MTTEVGVQGTDGRSTRAAQTTTDIGGQTARRRVAFSLVAVVLLAALFFRAHDLARVPPGLQGDEMFNAWDASQVRFGNTPLYFPANYGREPLFIYLVALSTRVLGMSTWSIRLPAVLAGLATVLFTYLLARRLLGFRTAVLAGALMAVSSWPVMISRFGLRAILLPACQAAALYALERALRERSTAWAVVAGVLMGLLPYTYIPAQFFPLVILAWVLSVLLLDRERRKGNAMRLLVVVGIALLVMLPLVGFALRHPDVVYQRAEELSYELDQLRAGNPGPVAQSARAVLRMFTGTGDLLWRYNMAGRPVFDRVTGAFFYLGLLVALWRVRQPASLLWLLWLSGMLLPAMLTGAAPSFLRSTGALVPIYVLPAIGANWVWKQARRWLRGPVSVIVPVLVGAGLLAVGADTWSDYFLGWARHPEVCHIYETDLATAARYLDGYEDADTPVWISSEHAQDLSRIVFGLQSAYPGPVRWFNGNHGAVWPSPAHGRDVLLMFTESAPARPELARALGPYLVYEDDAGCGRPQLWVYRLPQEALEEGAWRPASGLTGRFANGVELLGYDAPSSAERGSAIPFVLYWRVPAEHGYDSADPPRTLICLEDANDHCWSRTTHFAAYPLQDWTPGDLFAESFEVAVPEDLPPQRMGFRVAQFDGRREFAFAAPESGGARLRVGSLQVTGRVTEPPRWDASTPLLGDLALLDFSLPSHHTHSGGDIDVELAWQAVRAPETDYVALFELRDRGAGGEPISPWEDGLWAGLYPPSSWAAGEPVRSRHSVPVPREVVGGDYDVYFSLLDQAGGAALADPLYVGTVTVASRERNFEPPAPQFSLDAVFGSGIRLLGYDLRVTEPVRGGEIEVTLYWQALEAVGEDYAVFLHVYVPGGEGILTQHDSPPGDGTVPTNTWLPEEIIADVHAVAVPPDAPGGSARLGLGLYSPSTGERLPVAVDGAFQPDDRLILTEVEIE
jgi:4-amino-4-deoxy-L-arabinose transferase-like glycosyltransferase